MNLTSNNECFKEKRSKIISMAQEKVEELEKHDSAKTIDENDEIYLKVMRWIADVPDYYKNRKRFLVVALRHSTPLTNHMLLWNILGLAFILFIIFYILIHALNTPYLYSTETIPGYLEYLTKSPHSHLIISRHFLHSVYSCKLSDTRIRIKRQFHHFQALKVISSPASKFNVSLPNNLHNWNSILHPVLDNYLESMSINEKLLALTYILRAIGFMNDLKIFISNIKSDTLEDLYEIGKVLPWQQFVVYFTIPAILDSSIHAHLSIRGILKHVGQEALNKAKFLAKKTIFQTTDHFAKKFLDILEDLEIDKDIHIVSSSQELSNTSNSDLDLSSERKTYQPIEWEILEKELEIQRFKNKENVAKVLTLCLRKYAFTDIQISISHSTLIMANDFRKKLSWKRNSNPIFDALYTVITCSKLGIPEYVLSDPCNKDFFLFATKNALHRYLYVFNHKLLFNSISFEISILMEGKYHNFSEISSLILRSTIDPNEMLGYYNRFGISNTGLYEWVLLEPFIHALKPGTLHDPSNCSTGLPSIIYQTWGDRYIFEICSWITQEPRLGGDHTWFRLKTPDGDIYSVGQYRPKKMGFHEQFIFPMRLKVSKFSSPDICEFWSGPYTTLSVEISQNQFEVMKLKIQSDQSQKEHVYQLFKDNCVQYAMSIAKIAGIQFPTAIPILELLIRNEGVKNAGRSILNSKILPSFIRQTINYAWVFTMNWISVVLGAGMVDEEIKKDSKISSIEPFIKHIKDLADGEKVIANHPYVIGKLVLKDVEEWRTSILDKYRTKLDHLTDLLNKARKNNQETSMICSEINFYVEEMSHISFALPPKYRIPIVELTTETYDTFFDVLD